VRSGGRGREKDAPSETDPVGCVLAVKHQHVELGMYVVNHLGPLDPEGMDGRVSTGNACARQLDLSMIEDEAHKIPGQQIGARIEVDAERALEHTGLAPVRVLLLG
jgi:hypothetical protein